MDVKISKFDLSKIPDGYFIKDPYIKIPDRIVIFNFLKHELVKNYGLLTYIEGAEHPRKGAPAGEIVYAINICKEFIKQFFRNFGFIRGVNYTVYSINFFVKKVMYPYRVDKESLCTAAWSVYRIVHEFLLLSKVDKEQAEMFAYHVGLFMEFDDQYRFRAQDLAKECNMSLLLNSPRKEILRLMEIHKQRDHVGIGTHVKLMSIINVVLLLLLLPRYKKLIPNIKEYVSIMRPDDSDWYWMGLKDNYNFGGITHAERKKTMKLPVMYEVV